MLQYSYSPLICKANRYRFCFCLLLLPFVFAFRFCLSFLPFIRVHLCSSVVAFPLLLNPRQWRVVICFVLPQANASRDFPRPVAVRRVVKEVGFFVWVVVQVE